MSTKPPDSPVERVWKADLYRIQQDAPKPEAVLCDHLSESSLTGIYGREFHGSISHSEASRLLKKDGMYLVRTSSQIDGQPTLSLRFAGVVKHFRLYYDSNDGVHFVKETKRFQVLNKLVADGLVTMYVEKEAGTYLERMYAHSTYEESPYMTLNRLKRKALKRESNEIKNELECDSKLEPYDKAHAFRIHNFKGLNWCELCGNFLWGFSAQGVKCDDCGFSAHVRCGEKVPKDCCPELRRGVFGVDLTALCKARRARRPFIVDLCVQEIERRGLKDAEGLYRVPGFSDHIENLRMAFDRDGENTKMGPEQYDNINVIAGTLKLFLRLLPVPVINFETHPLLCKAADLRSPSEKIAAIREAVATLPLAHYHTLSYLTRHLARVTTYAETNKMPAHNLATVLAPTLMPSLELPKLTALGGMPAMASEICALESMILHHEHIFQ